MKKIIVFGIGKGAEKLWDYLWLDKCSVLCFVDNNVCKQNKQYRGFEVIALNDIPKEFDYVIISTYKSEYISEIYIQLKNVGVDEKKLVAFWDKSRIVDFNEYREFIDISAWQIELLNRELCYWKQLVTNIDCKYANLMASFEQAIGSIASKYSCMLNDCEQIGKKISLYIFGTGKGASEVVDYLYLERCNILGYIDNDSKKWGEIYAGKPIVSIDEIGDDYDYIIISTKILESTRSISIQLDERRIDCDRIIPFFDNEMLVIKNEYASFINIDSWRGALLNREIMNYERAYRIRIENMKYEVMDEVKNDKIDIPHIAPISKTLDLIINHGCSIARFGDGEFGLIDKQRFHKFQKDDNKLAERLSEVLESNVPDFLVAIADNYGSLENMTERGAESIRIYMTSGAREIQMKLLNLDREYHNAYLTRPYIYFKDKDNAEERFDNIKKIWDRRDVVIVEGHQTRLGIGNDLLDNAKSVRRILGPSTNAFDHYDEILRSALKIEKTALFLLALGPTATVLAYDLYKSGYQAIDIGHIDVEYEWYKLGVENPVRLGNKYVCEAPNGDEVTEVLDKEYLQQIIDRIY